VVGEEAAFEMVGAVVGLWLAGRNFALTVVEFYC
jgi:hypothetical protein